MSKSKTKKCPRGNYANYIITSDMWGPKKADKGGYHRFKQINLQKVYIVHCILIEAFIISKIPNFYSIDLLDIKMSKTDQEVHECIKENNNYTINDIALKLSKSDKTIYRSIKKTKRTRLY